MSDALDPLRRLLARALDPDPPPEFARTHISVLAFQGDRVLKAKQPVRFPFVDLSSAERRHAMCRREVELNRRLAPDVYRGVVDLVDEHGRVVDHAVEMRRMPDDRRLRTLVEQDAAVEACLDALADTLVRFHAAAERSPATDEAGCVEWVAQLWQWGFEQTADAIGPILDPATAARVEDLVVRFLAGRRPLLAARVAAGRSRDGHGDLLADDVFCLDDGPRVLDCLEFDDRLRHGDVLADIAFLAMDLERRGRRDLGRRFLDAYRTRAGDDWPTSLEDQWIAYRAHVRAKIACIRAEQGDEDAAARARHDLACAHRRLEHGRVRLVLVGGTPGTGKTTLATGLADAARLDACGPWTVLRSDVVRKELAGLPPDARARAALDEDLYRPEVTDAVYRELLDRARDLLEHGETVVLDASWAAPTHRAAAARLAEETSTDLVPLRCDVAAETAATRVAARREDASDATVEIAAAMRERFAPWPEATAIDTGRSRDETVEEAVRAVGLAGVRGSGSDVR